MFWLGRAALRVPAPGLAAQGCCLPFPATSPSGPAGPPGSSRSGPVLQPSGLVDDLGIALDDLDYLHRHVAILIIPRHFGGFCPHGHRQLHRLLTVKRRFIQPQDRVLFIDDFLANGEAALGAAKLIAMAGAQVAGMGCVIEKAFQPGRARLQGEGYNPVALASIAWMEDGTIQFTEE